MNHESISSLGGLVKEDAHGGGGSEGQRGCFPPVALGVWCIRAEMLVARGYCSVREDVMQERAWRVLLKIFSTECMSSIARISWELLPKYRNASHLEERTC